MEKEMKIYHTETQEDYDDLMIKLENEGYKWLDGEKSTSKNYWGLFKSETIVNLNENREYTMTYGRLGNVRYFHPEIKIIKHKAKGVNQMEKVVVPQFVADWFEQNKKGLTIYGLLHLFSDNYFLYDGFRKWVKDYDINGSEAQDIIAKMYLFQDYEVEEEKKYYWRKKKEHTFDLDPSIYINVTKYGRVFFSDETVDDVEFKTKFTEAEIKKLVSKEDFNKLERVEIDDV